MGRSREDTEARHFALLFSCIYIMNKRQKKKRDKKILLWELEQQKQKPKIERYGIDFNYEGYRDPTASAAIRSMMKDERVR